MGERNDSRPETSPLDRHAEKVGALRRAVFESEGVTDPVLRRAAAAGDEVPAPLARYLSRVREASFRIGDADIDELRSAGHGEEEIFELTVAAAVGVALLRLDAGVAAVRGGD